MYDGTVKREDVRAGLLAAAMEPERDPWRTGPPRTRDQASFTHTGNGWTSTSGLNQGERTTIELQPASSIHARYR